MKKFIFLAFLIPSFSHADRLGSLNANSRISLSTQAVPYTGAISDVNIGTHSLTAMEVDILNGAYGMRNFKDDTGNHLGYSNGDIFPLYLGENSDVAVIASSFGLRVTPGGGNGAVLYWSGSGQTVLDNWADYANILIGPGNLSTCYIGATSAQISGKTLQVNGEMAVTGGFYLYDSADDNYPSITTNDDTWTFGDGFGNRGPIDASAGYFTPHGDSSALEINGFSGGTAELAHINSGTNEVVAVTTTSLRIADGRDLVIGNILGTKFGQASSKIGFFNAPPVQRQSSTTDLKQSLVNLGLIAGAGATDLNLNGGNITTTGGITAGSMTVTGQNTTSTTTIVTAANSQTSDLAEWKMFSGNIVDRIGSNGLVTFSSMSVPGWSLLGGSVVANSSIYASSVAVKVGASAGNLAHVGGIFFDHYVSSGNTGTTETDLYVDTIPINGLNQSGQKVITMYAGTFVNSATATRQLKVKVSTTTIFDTGAISVSAASEWTINLVVIRDSASTVRCTVWMTLTGASTGAYDNYATVGGLTFSNANTIKVTGTAGAVGAATNDIVAQMGYMEYQPEQ